MLVRSPIHCHSLGPESRAAKCLRFLERRGAVDAVAGYRGDLRYAGWNQWCITASLGTIARETTVEKKFPLLSPKDKEPSAARLQQAHARANRARMTEIPFPRFPRRC